MNLGSNRVKHQENMDNHMIIIIKSCKFEDSSVAIPIPLPRHRHGTVRTNEAEPDGIALLDPLSHALGEWNPDTTIALSKATGDRSNLSKSLGDGPSPPVTIW